MIAGTVILTNNADHYIWARKFGRFQGTLKDFERQQNKELHARRLSKKHYIFLKGEFRRGKRVFETALLPKKLTKGLESGHEVEVDVVIRDNRCVVLRRTKPLKPKSAKLTETQPKLVNG